MEASVCVLPNGKFTDHEPFYMLKPRAQELGEVGPAVRRVAQALNDPFNPFRVGPCTLLPLKEEERTCAKITVAVCLALAATVMFPSVGGILGIRDLEVGETRSWTGEFSGPRYKYTVQIKASAKRSFM
jgi:hypothetical protein